MLEREFQKKRKLRNRIYSKTTVLILFVVIIIIARATWKVYKTNVESSRNLEEVSADLDAMRAREAELAYEISRLNTEKGQEEEIRKKFNVAKDGEGVVYVIETEKDEEEVVSEVNFIQKIWKNFKSFF